MSCYLLLLLSCVNCHISRLVDASQVRVSSSRSVKPLSPFGGLCIVQSSMMCCTDWFGAPHSHSEVDFRPHLVMTSVATRIRSHMISNSLSRQLNPIWIALLNVHNGILLQQIIHVWHVLCCTLPSLPMILRVIALSCMVIFLGVVLPQVYVALNISINTLIGCCLQPSPLCLRCSSSDRLAYVHRIVLVACVVIIVVFLCIQIYHQHGGDW